MPSIAQEPTQARASSRPPARVDASDAQTIARVRAGDVAAFEVLMRRYNPLVYRTVRSIARSDMDAEDVAQEAWIAAYQHLEQFEGKAAFSTWVTRIAIRMAMTRTRRQRPYTTLDDLTELPVPCEADTPPHLLHRRELAKLIEHAIDALPVDYRIVLVLRDVEQRSTQETADSLGLSEENVRVRLHRSRAALREQLHTTLGDCLPDAFAFEGSRCYRIVAKVLSTLTVQHGAPERT
jgi:RNA polymerase sigma-70 factor (ECF subfamily)